jgi:spore germination cell wall hydrolase CwlJ-like protein
MRKVIIITTALMLMLSVPVQAEATYTEDDLYVLSHIISAEAGNCSEDMMLSVGSVVLNRVADDRFPDTISEVVFQEGQYAPTWDGAYYNEPTEAAQKVAKRLLEEGSQIDGSVVFQAEFPQGNGVYDTIESPFGTTMYFCF